MLFDHFGVLGNGVHKVTATRVGGVALVFIGASVTMVAQPPANGASKQCCRAKQATDGDPTSVVGLAASLEPLSLTTMVTTSTASSEPVAAVFQL